MSRTLQFKRYANTVVANTTGAAGELIIETTNNIVTVHTGNTAGGVRMASEKYVSDSSNLVSIYAKAAYSLANVVSNTATLAYSQSNTATIRSQSGFDAANIAQNTANVAYIQSGSAFTYASGAYNSSIAALSQANIAFDAANVSFLHANAAFNSSNTRLNLGSLAFTQANTATNTATLAFDAANNASNLAQLVFNSSNTKLSSTGGTISGSVVIQQNLTVQGNVSYVGNVTSVTVSGNTGQFFGYTSNGFNALYAGIPTGYLVEPQSITQFTSNYDGYSGLNMQNINTGANASFDLFITADNGTSLEGYLDLGLASSNYNYLGYSLIKPNDGYLFVTGNTSTKGGNLIIGTGYVNNDIIFSTGGLESTNTRLRISGNTATFIANIVAPKITLAGQDVSTLINTALNAANTSAQTVPQNAQSSNYTLVASDAGKHLYYTQSSNVNLYIPWSSNASFANGTTIMIVSRTTSSANVTVTPNTGVTMYLAGNTTSASRNVTTYGMATLIQVAANTWMINGTGVV
jgi:hypothetical protein